MDDDIHLICIKKLTGQFNYAKLSVLRESDE